MSKEVMIILLSLSISIIGTVIGTLLGIMGKKISSRSIGKALSFSGGIMLILTFFELIPGAIDRSGIDFFMIFFSIGIVFILMIDYFSSFYKKNSKFKKAIMIMLGLMLHNFPEGLVMGIGFIEGSSIGMKMSILIAIHDLPEGIAIAAPLLYTNTSKRKIVLSSIITSIPAVLGTILAIVLKSISPAVMSISLSIAAGIMSYTVLFEIIPESREMIGFKDNMVFLTLGSIIAILMIRFI